MATRRERADALKAAAARISGSPILIDGDADDLLELLRSGSTDAGLTILDRHALAGRLAFVVILALDGDGRRSSFARAATLLRELEPFAERDAVRIAVVRSGRNRIAPDRLQEVLAGEIVFQISAAIPTLVPHAKWRTIRQRLGLLALDAAGVRILRFG